MICVAQVRVQQLRPPLFLFFEVPRAFALGCGGLLVFFNQGLQPHGVFFY